MTTLKKEWTDKHIIIVLDIWITICVFCYLIPANTANWGWQDFGMIFLFALAAGTMWPIFLLGGLFSFLGLTDSSPK